MSYLVKGYQPEKLFNYFEDVCSIPHGSGNEKALVDHLCRFAEENGLEYHRDGINNLLIKKPATAGYEDCPPVLLQGHTDMVCEKNNDTVHDFEKEGLKLIEKDGWLFADGTTLGGDDGVGVALMMQILTDKTVKHPPIECLFTVEEETGMGGAFGFDYSLIKAKRFINVDNESIDRATVSCAGGQTTEFSFDFERITAENTPVKLTVKGLAGGHSGIDINHGRQNAMVVMGRILGELYNKMPFNLVSITGGNKSNAIPRECECVISVFDRKEAESFVSELKKTMAQKMTKYDKGFTVRFEKYKDSFTDMFTLKDTSSIISFLNLLPNGVCSMSKDIDGLVETSSNLGILRTNGSEIKATVIPRSSVEFSLDGLRMKFDMLGKLTGATVSHCERYPGWEFKKDSKVRKLFFDCYSEHFGRAPRMEAIHAGLECGVINAMLGGDTDGVAICANVENVHTPDERLDLQSLSDAYEIICKMLERM